LRGDDVIRFATTLAKYTSIIFHVIYTLSNAGQGHFPFNQKRKGKSNVTEISPRNFQKIEIPENAVPVVIDNF